MTPIRPPGHQSRIALAGRQQAHLYSPVPGSQNAYLSPPPPSPTSQFRRSYPAHLLHTRAESVGRPRHYTHNARLLLPNNYAILHSHLCNHPTLSSPRVSNHHRHLGAPVILLPLLRTFFHSMMANSCLSSIVLRRFRTLSPRVQRID
jgi:hypothetical protein